MKPTKFLVAAGAALVLSGAALAAPTAEEAAQLGKNLTAVGAEKAGNADGTIPAYDGGICKAPANYKPRNGKGGEPYIDVYASEKPRLVITSKNMDEYADKIDAGAKVLLKRYPDTFRMDVYPTHRSACFPDYVNENTVKNVMKPKLEAGGLGVSGAQAQYPFPIPKDGYEAMWNTLVHFEWPYMHGDISTVLVDASGHATFTSYQQVENRDVFWDKDHKGELSGTESYWSLISTATDPASQAGVKQMRLVYLRPDLKDPTAYSYIPGQRRVRLAPEFKYDTVATASGGILLYDEINGFDGKMDKFDFKLVGKKEMFVPYNIWRANQAEIANYKKNNFDPDLMRWELHRVWEVEATLKPGQRHVQEKKIFYIDEDSWYITQYYGLDHAGNVQHYMQLGLWQQYEKPAPRNGFYLLYDLSRGIYSGGSQQGMASLNQSGYYIVPEQPTSTFSPDAMAGRGIR